MRIRNGVGKDEALQLELPHPSLLFAKVDKKTNNIIKKDTFLHRYCAFVWGNTSFSQMFKIT